MVTAMLRKKETFKGRDQQHCSSSRLVKVTSNSIPFALFYIWNFYTTAVGEGRLPEHFLKSLFVMTRLSMKYNILS